LSQPQKSEKVESIKIPEKKIQCLEDSKDSSNIHDSDEEENMNILINSLKNIVGPKSGEAKTEDENFAEEEKDRVYAK
jgi:hypothetical protein